MFGGMWPRPNPFLGLLSGYLKIPEKTWPEEGGGVSKEQALPLGQQWVRVPRAQGPGPSPG